MAHNDTDPAAPDTAPPETAIGQPPAARELGIHEARGQLGELADRARYLDEITTSTTGQEPKGLARTVTLVKSGRAASDSRSGSDPKPAKFNSWPPESATPPS